MPAEIARRFPVAAGAAVWLRHVCLADALDQLDELVAGVAVLAGVADELAGPGQDGTPVSGSGHGDAPAPAELQQALIAQHAQGTQHGVGIDVQHRRQVPGPRQPLAGADLPVRDRPADAGANLVIQRQGITAIQVDLQHNASDNSTMTFRQGTTVQVAGHSLPGTTAMPPGQDMAAEQALIAEARARTRRRRQKITLALIAAAAVLSAAGVLITLTPGPPHHAGAIAPAGPVIRTGIVTGHLSACIGPPVPPGHPLPVTPGTVMVVRGTARHLRQPGGHQRVLVEVASVHGPGQVAAQVIDVPGYDRIILPGGPVVARAYISNNYRQLFRFSLLPGTYVLIGRYGQAPYAPGTYGPYTQVSVIAGKTINADLPDDCA